MSLSRSVQVRGGSYPVAGPYRDFEPISLAQTNLRAGMLSRIDNKYIVNTRQFHDLLKLIQPDYNILEINGKREFGYSSCYYDDNFHCYFEHHQGRRLRLKVRTREYLDGGGMKYFEVKLKGARGQTVKHRSETDGLIKPRIKAQELGMLRDVYRRGYRKEMQLDLRPSLIIGYRRGTLVAAEGSERVTVDSRLGFAAALPNAETVQLGGDFIIVETKSTDGRGLADRALASLGIRQVAKCSKYCVGVNLTGCVSRNNNFLNIIRLARKNILETFPGESPAHLIAVGQHNEPGTG